MTRYRFRVRTPDGQEKVTELDYAPIGGPNELEAPEFANADFAHGETATVTVKGRWLDGRTVQFVLEHQGASGWEPYAEATAKMANGVATAQVDLTHPHVQAGGSGDGISPANLRMSCRLVP